MSDALLLDTHAWVWYSEGIIDQARLGNRLHVAAISVWEIGMLCAKEKISLSAPVSDWIRRALDVPGLRLLLLDAETALESTQLPDSPHGDPADRFLIAAARIHGLRLVTADRKIREYGKVGHARILAI